MGAGFLDTLRGYLATAFSDTGSSDPNVTASHSYSSMESAMGSNVINPDLSALQGITRAPSRRPPMP